MERAQSNLNELDRNQFVSCKKLSDGLSKVINKLDYNEEWILERIFPTYHKTFADIFNNIKNSKKSDMVISYGNNNYVSKILLTKIAKQNIGDCQNLKIINFNSFIHTSEDIILKKIMHELGIDDLNSNYDNAQRAIEDYYNNYPENEQTIIIIYFENIEHLFAKKKQVLIYTILEIVNFSKNLLFCGLTANFNLMDMMEKRNRSRFSQKTICVTINDFYDLIRGVEKVIEHVSEELAPKSKTSLDTFYSYILEDSFADFLLLIMKYIDMGLGIKEILTKIKLIFTLILIELNKVIEDNIFILKEDLKKIIQEVVRSYEEEEKRGSYFTLLKNFPKFHIILMICLLRRVARDKDRITIGMIYQEYSDYATPKSHTGHNKIKMDMILVKKALEELANSNLIYIKHDEKYLNIYELKLPAVITKNVIERLSKTEGICFDSDMNSMLNSLNL